MDTLILAGGLGTRLRAVIDDRAKAVAPVDGKPFIAHVMRHLAGSGIVSRFVMCVGHHADSVRGSIGREMCGIPVAYSRENALLGTGGALRLAASRFGVSNPFLAMNGDTVLRLNLKSMLRFHRGKGADLTLALSFIDDPGRFGTVLVESGRIIGFNEKGSSARGWINAGVYLFASAATRELCAMPAKFSLERDFFPENLETLRVTGYRSRAAFLDIGVPEDYRKATRILS